MRAVEPPAPRILTVTFDLSHAKNSQKQGKDDSKSKYLRGKCTCTLGRRVEETGHDHSTNQPQPAPASAHDVRARRGECRTGDKTADSTITAVPVPCVDYTVDIRSGYGADRGHEKWTEGTSQIHYVAI